MKTKTQNKQIRIQAMIPKTIFNIVAGLFLIPVSMSAIPDKQPRTFSPPGKSLAFTYSSFGLNARYDFPFSNKLFKKGDSRFYLELGGKNIKFKQQNMTFNKIQYPSDSRLILIGIGFGQEYIYSRLTITPFFGFRWAYIRFQSKALADAIGDRGLQRYKDIALTQPVGPPVENAYGNALNFDCGLRLSIILSKKVEILASSAFSPIKFDTASSLFGEFWGEAPYPNSYWVKMNALRFELGIRIRL
jgi:hypothetical protein